MSKFRKTLSLAAATCVLATSATPAFAQVTGYVTEKNGIEYEYDSAELIASIMNGGSLYTRYLEEELVALRDDKKGLIDGQDVINAIMNSEGSFNVDNYTESGNAKPSTVVVDKKVSVDESGEVKEEDVVVNVDTEAPVLSYAGETAVTVANGASFTAPEVTGTDNVDESVTVTKVIKDAAGTVVEAIDTTVAGTYTITYSAVDAAGNASNEVVITVTVEEAVQALKVESVSAINTTYVEVTFPALAEAKTGATIVVKDSTGAVVEVVAQDLAAGTTTAQFDLVTPVAATDLTGVWNVNGVSYSFTELKTVQDIVTASTGTVNEVKLYNLLVDAGIKNVNADLIGIATTGYAAEIVAGAPVKLVDVQKIIDDVNKAAVDTDTEKAVVKKVVDATNQIQLLAALKDNGFERVNDEWIAGYATETIGGTAMLALDGVATPAHYNVTKAQIQAAIDAENGDAITTDDTAANTAAKQAAVTALIQKWTADDVAPATTKADAIKASDINRLGFVVAEATTENSLYNALVAYANATTDTVLKASELNPNLKAAYLTALNGTTVRTDAVTGFTNVSASATYAYKANVVTAADTAAKNAAMNDIVTKFTALNSDATNVTKQAEFKASLQKLADVTSHETVANKKFLMSTIDDANLVAYSAAFDTVTDITTTDTVANVQAKVTGVNNSAGAVAQLKAINEATTAQEVKVVLDELAIADYVDVPSADKLHIAEQVLALRDTLTVGRDALAAAGTASGNTTTLANEFVNLAEVEGNLVVASTGVIAVYDALVLEFAYSELTSTSVTVTQLGLLGYDAFDNLTAGQKSLVAEAFKANYPMDSTPAAIDYATLKAVKTAIDTAIAGL